MFSNILEKRIKSNASKKIKESIVNNLRIINFPSFNELISLRSDMFMNHMAATQKAIIRIV